MDLILIMQLFNARRVKQLLHLKKLTLIFFKKKKKR